MIYVIDNNIYFRYAQLINHKPNSIDLSLETKALKWCHLHKYLILHKIKTIFGFSKLALPVFIHLILDEYLYGQQICEKSLLNQFPSTFNRFQSTLIPYKYIIFNSCCYFILLLIWLVFFIPCFLSFANICLPFVFIPTKIVHNHDSEAKLFHNELISLELLCIIYITSKFKTKKKTDNQKESRE